MPPDVFAALANPIRRDLLGLLRAGPRSAGDLADQFQQSRPSIAEHLGLLRDAGLVERHSQGRHNLYRLRAAPLREVAAWVDSYAQFWDERLDALETLLNLETP